MEYYEYHDDLLKDWVKVMLVIEGFILNTEVVLFSNPDPDANVMEIQICPNCGSINIEYWDECLECQDCHAEFQEDECQTEAA